MVNVVISDIALDHHNSTRQLVVDLMETETKSQFHAELVFIIARNKFRFGQNVYDPKLIEIFVPYYKAKFPLLRVIAEVYFCCAVIVVLYLVMIRNFGMQKRLAIISPPAFSSVILMFASWFRFNQRYLIQRDIYNEVWLSRNAYLFSLKHRILSLFLKLGYVYATRIGFENAIDVKQQTEFFPIIENKSEVLLNWCRAPEVCEPKRLCSRDETKLIYAGNVGIAQGPDTILKFLQTAESAQVSIDFFGSGSHFAWLKSKANNLGLSCKFYNAVSPVELDQIIQNYGAGLLFLNPDKPLNNFPGKALLYIKNDLPTISIAHPQSYIVEVLATNNLGVTINCPTDIVEVSNKFKEVVDLSNGSNGKIAMFARKNLSTEYVYERIFK